VVWMNYNITEQACPRDHCFHVTYMKLYVINYGKRQTSHGYLVRCQ
jgi:hypothetical protein